MRVDGRRKKRSKKAYRSGRVPGMKAGHCWVDGWSLDSKWYPWGYEVTVHHPAGEGGRSFFDVRWGDFDGSSKEARDAMVNKLIARASAKKLAKGKRVEACDETLQKSHPILHAFLTSREGETADKERKTSTLFIFTQDGRFTASLTDKEAEQVLWGSGESLKALFDDLEADLASDEPTWKPQKKWDKKAR